MCHVLFCGDVAPLLEGQTGTPPTLVRFPGAAMDFSPRLNFQCRLSLCVRTCPCAIACIYTCAHVKDPVVHVRVRGIMESLKHPVRTVGWVPRLCCSWLSTGKATRVFHGRNRKVVKKKKITVHSTIQNSSTWWSGRKRLRKAVGSELYAKPSIAAHLNAEIMLTVIASQQVKLFPPFLSGLQYQRGTRR